MTTLTLSHTRIRQGMWEAVVVAGTAEDTPPKLVVSHSDAPLGEAEVAPRPDAPGSWNARFAIPAETLSDGIQSFLITDADSGDKVGDFAILAGEAVPEDIRAEVALLRAELDMLKRAFRRHCVETL